MRGSLANWSRDSHAVPVPVPVPVASRHQRLLRIVFAEETGRYVPGAFTLGSGGVGYVRDGSLNLHEPGAIRALLDAASARGWQPGERRGVEVDGWPLLEAAAARAGDAGPTDP